MAGSQEDSTLDREELIRFFSVLSHDLKSPIFSIDGFSELLISDYADKLDEEGRDFLQRVRNSAQQMKRVLDQMSHLIKLLSRPDGRRPVDLNEVVEEIRLRFNYLIEEGGVDFQVAPNLPTVEADREKLRETIAALVSNALTFTDRPNGERRVSLTCDRESDHYRICVSDNGLGIDSRYIQQLFDLGLKLDKSRGEGPGYGLYLARKVVESGGGTLNIDSKLGEGTRVCFTLPAGTES